MLIAYHKLIQLMNPGVSLFNGPLTNAEAVKASKLWPKWITGMRENITD